MARKTTEADDASQEINPNDPDVRAAREAAVAYGERVFAGERPWDEDGEVEPEAAPYEPDTE